MEAVESPLRVTVGVEPFLLRSSLHAALAADERFSAYLCPLNADPVTLAQEVDSQVVIVSKPVPGPVTGVGLCVVCLNYQENTVAFSYRGSCDSLPYAGISAFRDELAAHARSLIVARAG